MDSDLTRALRVSIEDDSGFPESHRGRVAFTWVIWDNGMGVIPSDEESTPEIVP